MLAEIITIGNELLIGQVVDTNSAWMGEQMDKHGFSVNRITSISDGAQEIKDALSEALKRVDVVLLTGGLGPTKDDITKHTLCELFETKLVFNQDMYNNVCGFLKGRVNGINELNRGQAMVPEACLPILNPVGTAPIMWFDRNNQVVVSMPGVPHEMKTAMQEEIIPRLMQRFIPAVIIHQTVLVFNYPEAVLAERLSDWEDHLHPALSLAYLPSPGRIRLRLTAKGTHKGELQKLINEAVDGLINEVGEHIYGYADEIPAVILGRLLTEKKTSIATAESCTGGLIGHLLTSVPGSSNYYKGSIVAYDNEVKKKFLGVDEKVLEKEGAVSSQVVEQMAEGARRAFGTEYALATSGIAGPSGGTAEKPVGTVWIGLATPNGSWSMQFSFGQVRERNIKRSAEYALVLLIKYIQLGTFYQKPDY